MYKLNEFEVFEIVDKAVAFGGDAFPGTGSVMALQIALFWLAGYVEGRKNEITEDDIKLLQETLKSYIFI